MPNLTHMMPCYFSLLFLLPLTILISKAGATLAIMCWYVRVSIVGYLEFEGELDFVLFLIIWYLIFLKVLRWA